MLRNTRSTLVMALALAGGALLGSGLMSAPVSAQEYSEGFSAIYQPLADVVNVPDGDISNVHGQFGPTLAAVETEDDRYAIGNLILVVGNRLKNKAFQQQGLEVMLKSGKVDPAQIGLFNSFVGNLAYEAGEFSTARAALMKAIDAGYLEGEPQGLVAQTYFEEENVQGGVDYILAEGEKRKAAGTLVPVSWLRLSLQRAYDADLPNLATRASVALVDAYPSVENWKSAVQVVGALADYSDRDMLDVHRLLREAGGMSERADFIRYIEAADPRIMSNEVIGVLAEGLSSGGLSTSDDYYVDVKVIVDARAPVDQREAPGMVAEAQGSSDGSLATDAGDVLYSIADYAQAETLYQMALDKGVTNQDAARTHLGISQLQQGKYAEAQATFAQVAGARARIAKLWAVYAANKMM